MFIKQKHMFSCRFQSFFFSLLLYVLSDPSTRYVWYDFTSTIDTSGLAERLMLSAVICFDNAWRHGIWSAPVWEGINPEWFSPYTSYWMYCWRDHKWLTSVIHRAWLQVFGYCSMYTLLSMDLQLYVYGSTCYLTSSIFIIIYQYIPLHFINR